MHQQEILLEIRLHDGARRMGRHHPFIDVVTGIRYLSNFTVLNEKLRYQHINVLPRLLRISDGKFSLPLGVGIFQHGVNSNGVSRRNSEHRQPHT
ncbi:hypothetical protein D3C73_1465130 [compost metagenome]